MRSERLPPRWACLWLAAGLLVTASAGCGGGDDAAAGGPPAEGEGGPPGGAPPALVRVAEVSQRPLQTRWDAIGRLVELRRATIAAEVPGKVLKLDIEEGQRVTAGKTVLAEIDGVWTQLQLKSAEATIRSIEARLDQARRDLSFLEELAKRGSANLKEVEDARAESNALAAELEAAIADRNLQEERVQRLAVLAPFDGVVVAKHSEAGQWVNQGSPIVELITVGQIDAVLDVPERYIGNVRVGDRVPLKIEALGLEAEGEVLSIIPSGSNAARTFPVKIRLDDRGGQLKPGMSVIGYVPMSEARSHLAVPRDAVQFGPQGTLVWTLDQGEGPMPVAAMVPIQVLFAQDQWFAVEPAPQATLTDGQPVVVEGAEMLFPGRMLIVQGDAPPGAGPSPDAAAHSTHAPTSP